ncbi:MAG: metallophosphoesterase [Lachnospiraceae bacterium]|nr:metallophosphoesterase [Candidatus Equihabitans merdae]
MYKREIKEYQIQSPKIRHDISIAFLSDMHGQMNRTEIDRLISDVNKIKPNLILCGGDMMTANQIPSMKSALACYKKLIQIAPVYAVNGNHETYCAAGISQTSPYNEKYCRKLEEIGIHSLNNKKEMVKIGQNRLMLIGFEAEPFLYKKLRRPRMPEGYIDEELFSDSSEVFKILLAHNPYFGDEYFASGSDLILSGHYHAGIMRLGGNRILVSPYGFPFPRYGYGRFDKDGLTSTNDTPVQQTMIVSAGLGEHRLPFRINNPTELIHIRIKGV